MRVLARVSFLTGLIVGSTLYLMMWIVHVRVGRIHTLESDEGMYARLNNYPMTHANVKTKTKFSSNVSLVGPPLNEIPAGEINIGKENVQGKPLGPGASDTNKQIETEKTKETSKKASSRNVTLPWLYLITPTYARSTQKVDLIRMLNTLLHVPRLHWIVIEDSVTKTSLVTGLFKRFKISHTHLNVKTIRGQELKKAYNVTSLAHKGMMQRNAGLDWVIKNGDKPSVIYFADDDNTYDLELFEEMRYTKKVSVWPVGLVADSRYESPAVKNGKVVGWIVGYLPQRKFATDMAGFAVSTEFYLSAGQPRFSMINKQILEEYFLEKMKISLDDLEPRAANCTKVLVWHTKTRLPTFHLDKTREKLRKTQSAPALEV